MEDARDALTWHDTDSYYDILSPHCSTLDLWETEYFHIMDSHEAILDFIRGSGLRPFVQALDSEEEIAAFESLVLEAYRQEYAIQPDRMILFPFRRQFVLARA